VCRASFLIHATADQSRTQMAQGPLFGGASRCDAGRKLRDPQPICDGNQGKFREKASILRP
jgi:hypothetical protein